MLKKGFALFFAITLFLFILGGTVLAEDILDENITLLQDEVVDDDFYAAGRVVTMLGTVLKDFFAIGEIVSTMGEVGGDVLATGLEVSIDGSVDGNLRAVGRDINIKGTINRAATLIAQKLTVFPDAIIGRNLLCVGEELSLEGTVNGNVRAAVNRAVIGGKIAGDIFIQSEEVIILPSAFIDGDVVVRGMNPAEIQPGAVIQGEVKHIEMVFEPEEEFNVVYELSSLALILGLALLLGLFASPFLKSNMEVLRTRPLAGFASGLAWLVVVPFITIGLVVTIIGFPAAFALGITYITSLTLAAVLFKPILGALLGTLLLQRMGEEEGRYTLIKAILLGTLIFWLVGLVPIAGAIVAFFGMFLVLGSWLIMFISKALSLPGAAD